MKIAYLAGFMDGEGCIAINEISTRKGSYKLSVTIGNTNKEILELIQENFGGKLMEHKNKSVKSKISYSLDWWGKGAKILLEEIKSELIIKKIHAELACMFPMADIYTNNRLLLPIEKDFRKQLCEEFKKLNKRGV